MLHGSKFLSCLVLALGSAVAAPAGPPMRVVIACDDRATIYLNGVVGGEVTDWEVPLEVDLGGDLFPMVIAVEAANLGGPGGLIGALKTRTRGVDVELAARWRCAAQREARWYLPEFDDRHWSEATEVAAYGAGPWLDRAGLGLEEAAWVWLTAEPPIDTIFCRWVIKEKPQE